MSFVITARTILHLGSDLISSDAVAIYELIKNAIDAKSKNGVDVSFDIVIRQSDFSFAMSTTTDPDFDLEDAKQSFIRKILPEARPELRKMFLDSVQGSETKDDLRKRVLLAYRESNRIIVSDSGHGMTRDELKSIYLTIGTISRAKAVREALRTGNDSAPPYLGEKGVGRLAVMRLGWKVHIETVTSKEKVTNVLEIDWKRFEEADDAAVSTVELNPVAGNEKTGDESFTRITISDLRSSWSISRLNQIAREQIARMMDPFSWEGRRFQIRLSINGVPIQPVRQIVDELLQNAHAKCVGKFYLNGGRPALTAKVESSLYLGDTKELNFDLVDLMGMVGLRESGLPSSVLRSIGPFTFELYWFNRQRLRGIPDVGDRKAVSDLVRTWAGVCLFRDGFRVLPYGDPGDDWLGLDITALASSGYKLNTKQIIGRVNIGRTTNPCLLDQTNRQGLLETPEKEVLVTLMRSLVSSWWHDYLNEASQAQKRKEIRTFDPTVEGNTVEALELRATQSLKDIRTQYSGEAQLLRDVRDAFAEVKEAHQRAVQRILTIEEEKERLTQLAGVGLMVEVIAHELTRATELTQATLKDLGHRKIDSDVASAFRTLGEQIKVIQKRLQTLEPLSITARFRRSKMRLFDIVKYVIEGHSAQFARHDVDFRWMEGSEHDVVAFVIEGHIVQILENLINNSIYWLDTEKKDFPSLHAQISLGIYNNPPRIIYSDNGPGIPPGRNQLVFEPFFSTKSGMKARRQGLGLYIARQNAEALGGSIELVQLGSVRENRYNTFQLDLREGPNDSE